MKFIDRTGEMTVANNGQTMTIISCRNAKDIDVQFEDGTVVRNRAYGSFKRGEIANPDFKSHRMRDRRVGETNIATNSQKMTIIAYRSATDIDIQFEDGAVAKHMCYGAFKTGHIANPDSMQHVGESTIATNGQKMTIIAYRSAMDIDIQFEDGAVVRNRQYGSFKRGKIANPDFKSHRMRDRRVGESTIATNGQKMTIIAYRNSDDIDIQFEDGAVVRNRQYGSFKRGKIANPDFRPVKIIRSAYGFDYNLAQRLPDNTISRCKCQSAT